MLQSQPFGEASDNYRIVRSDYENSSGEKASTTFYYNKSGQMYKSFWLLSDKSRSSVNHYNLSNNGNLIAAFREFSDSITTYEHFNYNADGYKIAESFVRSDSVYGSASWEYEASKLKKGTLHRYKGWLNGTISYTYLQNNQKENGFLVQQNDTVCHIFYTYDAHQNLVEEYWDFSGKWFQKFKYSYEKKDADKIYYSNPVLPNTGNYRIIKEYYTYNDKTGGPSNYYYDQKGRIEKKIFSRSDGLTTTTLYFYSNSNQLIESKRAYNNGDTAHFHYIYNFDDNLIARTCIQQDTLTASESYFYDETGKLIHAYLNNFDAWLSGTITFYHNKMNEIVGGKFISENGFDADIICEYDKNRNMTIIIWNFSFGKFQRYEFEYEKFP